MEKNEILSKSRQEYQNEMSDERDRSIELSRKSWGSTLAFAVWFLLLAFNSYHNISSYDLWIMFGVYHVGHSGYSAFKDKNKGSLVTFLLALALVIYNLIKLLSQR